MRIVRHSFRIVAVVLLVAVGFATAGAGIIGVPGEQPTIQAGLDAAATGDTVLVEPGTYFENIDFGGRSLVLASRFLLTGDAALIAQTIIDGGVFCGANSNPRLTRVVITRNTAGSLTNLSGQGGGLHCLSNASPVIANSILWANTPQEIYFNAAFDPNDITIAYSDVLGGESGIVVNGNGVVHWLEGNINLNPLFVDPWGTGDFHLLEESPCVYAGTAFLVVGGETIVDMDPADYSGEAPDMGAFEFLTLSGLGDWTAGICGRESTFSACAAQGKTDKSWTPPARSSWPAEAAG